MVRAVGFARALMLVLMLWLPSTLLEADSVTVTITVDNGYGFGFGDQNGIFIGQYYGGVDNCTAAQIFGSPCYVFVPPDGTVTDTGPEIYNITAGANDYIYIVAWSDDASYQGTVASFVDNTTATTVTTSPAWPWQVYATGTNWQPNCSGRGAHGPPLTGFSYAINNQIAVANANGGATGTTSVGWVGANGGANGSLYFGGYGNSYNNFNYPFAIPGCIASGATWIEYDPEPTNVNCNPFQWASVSDYVSIPNFLREYLIYRIGPLSELTTSNTCSNGCFSISTPTNIVIDSCTGAPVFYTPSVIDTCCPGAAVTLTCNPPSGSYFYPGTTTVTCDALDACGISNSCSFTVTVLCTNCLQVQCPSNKTVQCGTTWTFDQPIVSTCCTNLLQDPVTGVVTNVLVIPTSTVTNGTCPQVTVTETWAIMDGCGNSTNCSQTVTILGCCNCLQVQCPTNKTVQCGSTWTFDQPTASTCCTSNVSGLPIFVLITPTGTVTNGVCPQVAITQNWLITDGCGDSTNCSQTVTVLGCCSNCISLTCPSNIMVTTCSNCALVYYSATATNTCCQSNVALNFNPPSGTCLPVGTNTVQVTAYDPDCTSTPPATCSFTVTVVAVATQPLALFNTGVNSSGNPLAGGSVDPHYTLLSNPNNYSSQAIVVSPIVPGWMPNDAISQWIGPAVNGGTATGTYIYQMTFFVSCTNNLLITGQWAADNLGSIYVDSNSNSPVSTITTVTSASFTTWHPFTISGGLIQGTHTLTFVVTNLGGATGLRVELSGSTGCCMDCLQVVCPTNKTVECGSAWTFNPPTASSCCPSNISGTKTNLLIIPASLVTNGVCPKFITKSWLITDACGNIAECSQTVTVVDTTPPVINCPTNTLTVALNTNCQLVIPTISVSATDNCTPLCSLIYSQSPPAGTIVNGTSACVTVTVTDLCGNSSSCVVCVVGVPKAGLVVNWPANVVASNCVVPCVHVTVKDCACPMAPIITQSPPCGTPVGPGITSVTVTVTDCNGIKATKVIPLVVPGVESFLSALANTGISLTGTLLPQSAIDPHYLLGPVAGTPPGYTAPNALVVTNLWPWLEVTHVSQWIAPNTDLPPGYNLTQDATGYYTYTYKFTLPAGANPATASISGRWAADDGAVLMKINSTITGNTIPVSGSTGFTSWHYFTINSGFQSGVNTILFVVTNGAVYVPSPTGLRVEYTNASVCSTCAPPNIISITPSQSLQEGSTATFTVMAGGTPPLSYQWQFNGGSIEGATNSTLQLPAIGYSTAGLYTVIIGNPCGGGIVVGNGAVTGTISLQVTPALPWPNATWNVADLTNPLGATYGPDLILVGTDSATNFPLSVGTTEDFGLPDPGGQIVNVMDINPQAGDTIGVPPVTAAGSASDNSYTLIMDLYEPDTSLGTPSTLFQSIACCISNLGSSGQDGVGLTLDVSNNLHITGSSGGVPFDYPSTASMPVDAWNRVALVVDNPQDGIGANVMAYLNGQITININPCPCCVIVITNINWNNGLPTLFTAPTTAASPNVEFYVSSIQFHAVAMTPQMIDGIGSPDNGPAPMNETAAGPSPLLSAALVNGVVNISWTGTPYLLQETTDLSTGVWENSELPFTETGGTTGNIITTAVVTPVPSPPSKFYRLIFAP